MNSTTQSGDGDHTPESGTQDRGEFQSSDAEFDDLPPEPGEESVTADDGRRPKREVVRDRPGSTAEVTSEVTEAAPPASPARSKGRKTATRGKRSSIDKYRNLVGVMTDAEVAQKAGVTSSAVAQYRTRRGIAAALPQGSTRRAQRIRQGAEARPAVERPTPPNRDRAERRNQKAPAAAPERPRLEPVAAVPATAMPAMPAPTWKGPMSSSEASYGWKVQLVVGSQPVERVVLATDATSACEQAACHGEVLTIERLTLAL